MDAKSQLKVTEAGFFIIRKDDQPNIRIKYKSKTQKEWATMTTFPSKAARDRKFNELMAEDNIIND